MSVPFDSQPAVRPSNLDALQSDGDVRAAVAVIEQAWSVHRYSYNFTWLGVPVIQIPQDLLALQEVIWTTKPDLIIETGVAHGGSLVFFASMLQILGNGGRVVGIDIDIRPHNRERIEAHPLAPLIELFEGSSVARAVIDAVNNRAAAKRVMVVLDSNHTHEHVLAELRAYAPLVGEGCYCCVMDTIVERMPEGTYADRPWSRGNSPMTAVDAFLSECEDFAVDDAIDRKLQFSMAPRGYLQRVKRGAENL